MHDEKHPLAGQTVTLVDGTPYRLEDWWDRVSGNSWRTKSVIASLNYADMQARYGLPDDDEVVYGHVGGLGYLMHVSQLTT